MAAAPPPVRVLVFPEERGGPLLHHHHRKTLKESHHSIPACERKKAMIFTHQFPIHISSKPAHKLSSAIRLSSSILLCCGILTCTLFLFLLTTVDTSLKPLSILHSRYSYNNMNSSPLTNCTEMDKDVVDQNRALKGLGTVYRNGNKAMDELIVVNLVENLSKQDFGLFLRTLHISGATASADVSFLFPWSPTPASILQVLREEEAYFQNLTHIFTSSRTEKKSANILYFNYKAFIKAAQIHKPKKAGFVWGNRTIHQHGDTNKLGYGSVVGFEMDELDPLNLLRGFIDDPPSQLRRWVCYQMLLGMVKSRYKRVLLIELGKVAILGDPLVAVRHKDCLYLTLEDNTWNDNLLPFKPEIGIQKLKAVNDIGKDMRLEDDKQSEIDTIYGTQMAEQEAKLVNTGVLMGSVRLVVGLVSVMVNEIVRISLEIKSRQPFPDTILLSYLMQESSVLGKKVKQHVKVVSNEASAIHSQDGSRQPLVFFRKDGIKYTLVHASGGYGLRMSNSNHSADIGDLVRKEICSWTTSAAIYDDCNFAVRSN